MNLNDNQFKTMLLLDPEMRLQSFEKELKDFGLPKPSVEDMCQVRSIANIEAVIIPEEKDYDVEQLVKSVQESTSTFTKEQQQIFKDILAAVKRGEQLLAFVDARGGCGKTYLLNTVLSAVRSLEPAGCIALAMATTGIAANLLNLGRTFHSRLKAPLVPTEHSMLQISAQSSLAKLIQMAKLLLIDESTMLDRFQLEALYRTLKDIMGIDKPFGGKILILAGDFRQCLPVVPGANRAETVAQCINKSHLWQHFSVYQLRKNLRVRAAGDQEKEYFDRWTLSIRNGMNENGRVSIPEAMLTKIVPNTKDYPKNEERCMNFKKFLKISIKFQKVP